MTEATDRLKSEVKDLSPSRMEIAIELSAEEAEKEHDVVLARYAERARLKGFRPGKAPRDMVLQVYHHDIHHTLIDTLVPKVLEEVLAARQIHPASSPVVEDLSFDCGQPLKFKALVEVWPAFVLPAYKKIKAVRKDAVAADADVDKTLEELRQKAAEYVPVEGRAVIVGDYVAVELQGRDLKTKRMRPLEKTVLLAGHEGNDKALNDHVVGLQAGETAEFRLEYPADSPNKSLAGRTVDYRLKVVSIKAQKLPDLNDDFAKSLGEYADLADLREKIRREILKSREAAVRRDASEDVLRQLTAQADIDLPPTVIDEEADSLLRKMAEQIPPQGLSPQVVEQLRAGAREQAVSNLKRTLLLRRIAEAERLAVAEDEVDEEIRALARANGIPPARLMDSFNAEGRRESLKSTLLLRKAVDFVTAQSLTE
jgi:trigger factor